jgi:hypothetical protein
MFKRVLMTVAITVALVGAVSAAIPWPPCQPCLVDTSTAR